jgi:phage/plasmid primase-like uncharacterized protein
VELALVEIETGSWRGSKSSPCVNRRKGSIDSIISGVKRMRHSQYLDDIPETLDSVTTATPRSQDPAATRAEHAELDAAELPQTEEAVTLTSDNHADLPFEQVS